MLNREERRGLFWVLLFGAVLGVAVILLLLQAAPGPAPSSAGSAEGLPLAALLGRFVDARTDEPLATPQIAIPALDGISDHWMEEEDPLAPGRFRVGGLPGGGPYEVHFRVDGYEHHREAVTLTAGQALDLGDLRLRRLVAVNGWTVSEAGQPVAGAVVEAMDAAGALLAEGRSDARGAYRLEALPEDLVTLAGRAEGRRGAHALQVDLKEAAQRHERVLELPLDRVLSGHLTVAGRGPSGRLLGGESALTMSAEGALSAEPLPADLGWLAYREGDGETTYLPFPMSGRLELDLPPLVTRTVRFPEPAPVRGPVLVLVRARQTDAAGLARWTSLAAAELRPGGEASLSFRPGKDNKVLWLAADGSSSEQEIREADAAWNPSWRPPRSAGLRPAPAGLRFAPLDAHHAAWIPSAPEPIPDWDLADPSWIAWRLQGPLLASLEWPPGDPRPSEPVRGRVLDQEGNPVAWARVSLFLQADREPALLAVCLTDSGGVFHLLRPALAASASLLVESQDSSRVAQPLAPTDQSVELQLPRPAVLRLEPGAGTDGADRVAAITVVLDPAVPQVPWDSRQPGVRGNVAGRALGDGTWLVPGLPPGPCRVQVHLRDGSVRSFEDLHAEEPARAALHALPLTLPGNPDDS